ncbi:MAG TPA: DUF4129 domain-containing protein [Acidimicrobiales bacterium]|nr:DUF4129 domain-containing protein [Acidimicrobiales bacterium]
MIRPIRRPPGLGLAVGIVSLLFVVVAASGAGRPGGTGVALNPSWALDAAASVGAGALVLTVAALAFAFWPARDQRQRRGARRPLPSSPWVRILVGFVWLAGLGLLVTLVVHPTARQLPGLRAAGAAGIGSGHGHASGTKAAPATIDWWVVLAVVGAVGIAGGALWWRWGRRPLARITHDHATAAVPAFDVLHAVDESLSALEAEEDNRRAVIAAYTGMQRSLARAGHPAAEWEAPFEYLARVASVLGGSSAAGTSLTGLFERARYSSRDVGTDMKRSAIDALIRLREGLTR